MKTANTTMKTNMQHHFKSGVQAASILVCLAASALTASAADSDNLILNPSFESANGNVAPWRQQVKGSLESFINPADSVPCGRINFTFFTADNMTAKSSVYQCLKSLQPGTYIYSFSCSGEDLTSIYTVVRFQEQEGIADVKVIGQFVKSIPPRDLPQKGEWKDYAFSFNVPEGTVAGTVIVEVFGGADQSSGHALLKNMKLVKQEE